MKQAAPGPVVNEPLRMTTASAVYYGDEKDTGTGYYTLLLRQGSPANGKELRVELFGDLKPETEQPSLTAGEYQSGTGDRLTYVVGASAGRGTNFVTIVSGEETFQPVEGGTFTIAKEGTTYTVTTELTDAEGNEVNCIYTGTISVTNDAGMEHRVAFESVIGNYWGDVDSNETGMFDATFTGVALDGTRYILVLELFSDLAANPAEAILAAHEYTVVEGGAKYTITPGVSDGVTPSAPRLYAVGSSLRITGDGTDEDILLDGGKVNVTVTGGTYDITFDVASTNKNDIETKYYFEYKGAIDFEDRSTGIVIQPTSVTALVYEGNFAEIDGRNEWTIFICTGDIVIDNQGSWSGNNGSYINVHMGADGGPLDKLPQGVYTFNKADQYYMIPGTVAVLPMGTVYLEFENHARTSAQGLKTGTLTVSLEGDTYTLGIDFVDSLGIPVTGTYQGQVNVVTIPMGN